MKSQNINNINKEKNEKNRYTTHRKYADFDILDYEYAGERASGSEFRARFSGL